MNEQLPIDNEAIRLRLKEMIDTLGIGNTGFANSADITPSVVSNIMNGKSNITFDTLNKVLTAYPDWERDWLLFGEGTPLVGPKDHNTDKAVKVSESNLELTLSNPSPSEPIIDNAALRSIIEEVAQKTVNGLKDELLENKQKEIIEIRVFYSDGSYETFPGKQYRS